MMTDQEITQEICVPTIGESIREATVSQWLAEAGQTLAEGDPMVELETDKVTMEIPAPQAGQLKAINKPAGETVAVGEVLGIFVARTGASAQAEPGTSTSSPPAAASPAQPPPPAQQLAEVIPMHSAGPSVRRTAEAQGISLSQVRGSGPRGRITLEDLARHASASSTESPPPETVPQGSSQQLPTQPPTQSHAQSPAPSALQPPAQREKRVKFSRLRQRIAERLLDAQRSAAILTTFNEADMSEVIALRTLYKESFRKQHGVGLGFMSFFTCACVHALKAFPMVNAELAGDELIYKYHYDIGVAVGTERGLVVPVVRDANARSFAEIEREIGRLATRAREGQLTLADLAGGTFTISNGGIYGSMMSTPILNLPQVAILGLHNIVQRPIARHNEVVIRPMMYLALSYDHRVIDGSEAVQFLTTIKRSIEEPARLMLDL